MAVSTPETGRSASPIFKIDYCNRLTRAYCRSIFHIVTGHCSCGIRIGRVGLPKIYTRYLDRVSASGNVELDGTAILVEITLPI